MRFLLVALMIALLPVRAWLGDAMAMQTLSGFSETIEIVAISAGNIRAGATFYQDLTALPLPCHATAATPHHASNAATPPEACEHTDCADCHLCPLCQLCHSMVLVLAVAPWPLLALPAQWTHGDQTLFASAPRAPHLKPPIF
jgi:hypothetical protein